MLGLPVGVASGTAMVQAPMELVDGTGQSIVPIHEIGIGDGPDGLFAPIADVSDSVCTGPLLGK